MLPAAEGQNSNAKKHFEGLDQVQDNNNILIVKEFEADESGATEDEGNQSKEFYFRECKRLKKEN